MIGQDDFASENFTLGLLTARERNFQVMPGAEWLELLCEHIPDCYEHLGLVFQPGARRTGEGREGPGMRRARARAPLKP